MAKTKKKVLSEVIINKKKQTKSLNPFEVRVNREKFNVIGRVTKFSRGLPGVARSKAIQKRKETLLQEYKVKDKSNKFFDKRIGERSKAMTNEDKIIARYTAEKMRAHKKRIFNLADDEVLTHKGRSITEVERFDDPRSEDEEDNDVGALDADFVDSAHFGGGTLTKSKVSRESVIDQLIADSKKRKIERHMTKEKTLQLTEQLDAEWKDLVPLMRTKKPKEDEEDTKKRDPYDLAMKELIFEARGKPSDRLKSEEEIVAEEMKKLQELEEERLRRMKGEDTEVTVVRRQHRSADDLDDGFQLDEDPEFSLMYDKDGNLIKAPEKAQNFDDEEQNNKKFTLDNENDDDEEDLGEEEEEDDENSSENEFEDSDEESEDDFTDLKPRYKKDEESEDEESDNAFAVVEEKNKKEENSLKSKSESESEIKVKKHDANVSTMKDKSKDNEISVDLSKKETPPKKRKVSFSEQENDSSSGGKKFSPEKGHSKESCKQDDSKTTKGEGPKEKRKVKTSESSNGTDYNEEETTYSAGEINEKKKVSFKSVVDEVTFGENAPSLKKNTVEEFRLELSKKKELMDKARKELPYTFNVPETYDELEDVLKEKKPDEVAVIIERMIKCNHPMLKEENKEKMSTLFTFLMQYINDLDFKDCWIYLDRMVPFLYDLAHFSPLSVTNCLVEILKEKHTEYLEKDNKYPSLSTLMFLKLIPLLFPASDKRHPVTTPALVFMTQILQKAKVNSRVAITSGLFISSLIYEYASFSKRISPQAVNFLLGLLHIASDPKVNCNILPPFLKNQRYLYLQQPYTIDQSILKMNGTDLSSKSGKIDDTFRVRSMFTVFNLLNLFIDLYKDHPGASLLFKPFEKYLSSFPVQNYQTEVKDILTLVNENHKSLCNATLKPICRSLKKPKALRLYEPTIEPVYETRKRKVEDPVKAEKERLMHKYKKEMKGAIREIRRDTKFISKVKFKEQAVSDAERKRKVQQIYTWASEQQADLRKLEKQKRKHKF